MSVQVGSHAPDFCADGVVNGQITENIRLSDYKGKYVLLFFYPLDFTFVCPTELLKLQEKYDEFKSLNTEILAVSVDSAHSHFAWLNTSRSKGGIEGVNYPIISDITKTISTNYGTLLYNQGVSLRGAFVIDRNGILKHQTVNDLPLGRNIDEFIRIVKAIQFHEKNGEVCPANWTEGADAMKPSREGVEKYFSNN